MWRKALSGAAWSRLVPYIVLALVASHALAYGKGSWDGYDKAEVNTLKAVSKAWESRLERDRAIVANDAEVGKREETVRYKIIYKVAAVPVGQCVFTDECLRFYTGTVRAANTAGQDASD